jgi:beta-1,4-mannosyl-glycoprotein beta-1,4-N-acetylglucosaminyltransferase
MQSLPWECEFYQRNKLSDGLRDAKDNDLIVLSDVDEIPSPDVMGNFKKISQKNIVTVFDQRFFSYFLNCENKNRWCGSVIFSYHIFKKAPMQDVRKIAILCNALKHDRRFPYVLKTISEFFYMTILKAIPIQIIKGGWHFTSIGDIKNIQKKLHSFAHSEASSIADDEIATQRMINAGINIFNGKQESHFVKIDETFPRCLQNTEKFKKLIKEV